jgi:uncharacterized protein YbjT (DUF2867 family)
MRVLVIGASGYVGGRLVPQLLAESHDVICLARSPEKVRASPWSSSVTVVPGDALDQSSCEQAMREVDTVFYLVHSIGSGASFEETDRRAATVTAASAARSGVRRIVYLGGLVPTGEVLSPHLKSRAEVGQIFLDAPTPAVVIQAGVIIGSGSASFEMLRYLTERLPIMITPTWVRSLVQPIAVRDVLSYLRAALSFPEETNRRFDIGGPDIMSYRQMMQRYATIAELRPRIILAVPVLSPWLSSQWVNLVTPVPKTLAQPLIESLRNSAVTTEHDIEQLYPLDLCPFDEAVELALERTRDAEVLTRWSGATWPGAPSDSMPTDPEWSGGTVYQDDRTKPLGADTSEIWRMLEEIGGDHGWYSFPLAWMLRGLIDRLVGGVGLRRGRRDPEHLAIGDAVDFWRVEALEPERLLRLRAEMRLPGEAWLEFSIESDGERPVLRQRALFIPRGLPGHLYWWAISPFHGVVFGSMIANIASGGTIGSRKS